MEYTTTEWLRCLLVAKQSAATLPRFAASIQVEPDGMIMQKPS